MNDLQHLIESALQAGDWDRLGQEAATWIGAAETAGEKDPRPYFALNVTRLLRGDFAEAWKLHAQALQEADDIDQVRGWIQSIVEQHPDNAHVHLVEGLFLAQSGQSEQSMASYKKAVRLRSAVRLPALSS